MSTNLFILLLVPNSLTKSSAKRKLHSGKSVIFCTPNYPLIASTINCFKHLEAYCVSFLCKLFCEQGIKAIKKALCRRKYLFERDLQLYWKCKRTISIGFFMKLPWTLVSTPLHFSVWSSWNVVCPFTSLFCDQFFDETIQKVSRYAFQRA